MSNRVGIPVHHQERIFSARDYKMLRVIARTSRRFQKIVVARFLLEVLDAPRGPERFYFVPWKFFLRHGSPHNLSGGQGNMRSKFQGSARPRAGDPVLAITNAEGFQLTKYRYCCSIRQNVDTSTCPPLCRIANYS